MLSKLRWRRERKKADVDFCRLPGLVGVDPMRGSYNGGKRINEWVHHVTTTGEHAGSSSTISIHAICWTLVSMLQFVLVFVQWVHLSLVCFCLLHETRTDLLAAIAYSFIEVNWCQMRCSGPRWSIMTILQCQITKTISYFAHNFLVMFHMECWDKPVNRMELPME